MSAVEFVQHGLRNHIAPPSLGSVKARMRHANAVLRKQAAKRRDQWTQNRVKDCWYADPRISPSPDEVKDIEELTGLRYGREELRSIDELISQADSLLEGSDSDFVRPFVDAMRTFFRSVAGSGTAGTR